MLDVPALNVKFVDGQAPIGVPLLKVIVLDPRFADLTFELLEKRAAEVILKFPVSNAPFVHDKNAQR